MYGIIKNSKVDLLYKVDQLKIWRMILGLNVDLNQMITSPFRADNIPTCYLREWNGQILFTDWAFTHYNKHTIIHAIAELNGISHSQATDMVHDYHYYGIAITVGNIMCTSTTRKVIVNKEKSKMFFEPYQLDGQPSFTDLDKQYWSKRDVSFPELLNNTQPCYSVKSIKINDTNFLPKTYPCYALTFENSSNFKLYCPLNSKAERFPVSSATRNDYWKWIHNTNSCVITKSFKDGYLINKLTGIDTFAFQSESMYPDDLSFLNNYDNKVILYDNDTAGYEGSMKLQSTLEINNYKKVKRIYYPQLLGKDTDDVVVNGYKNYVNSFVKSALYE